MAVGSNARKTVCTNSDSKNRGLRALKKSDVVGKINRPSKLHPPRTELMSAATLADFPSWFWTMDWILDIISRPVISLHYNPSISAYQTSAASSLQERMTTYKEHQI